MAAQAWERQGLRSPLGRASLPATAPHVDGRLKAREFGPLAGGGVKSAAGQKREGPVIKTEPSTTGTWS